LSNDELQVPSQLESDGKEIVVVVILVVRYKVSPQNSEMTESISVCMVSDFGV